MTLYAVRYKDGDGNFHSFTADAVDADTATDIIDNQADLAEAILLGNLEHHDTTPLTGQAGVPEIGSPAWIDQQNANPTLD